MFIQQSQKIIEAFCQRYIKHYSQEDHDFERADIYEDTYLDEKTGKVTENIFVKFYRDDYYLKAYFNSEGEFCIDNPREESIYIYAEENGWSKEDVEFMKKGERL